jgi:hypothetical protein
MKTIALSPLLLAAACASSPFNQPYAEIWADRAPAADPNVVPVVLNRIDDRTTLYPDHAVVPPGHHVLTVDVPPRAGFTLPTQEDVALDAEPCTRYFLAARLDTPVTQEWKPVVRAVEPIGECRAKWPAGR